MIEICSLSVLVLHETLLVPILTYGSETMLWKKKGCINGQPQRFSKYQENG